MVKQMTDRTAELARKHVDRMAASGGACDFARDVALRRALIQRGVFFVPIATKQCSLSASHSQADVQFTLEQFESAVSAIW